MGQVDIVLVIQLLVAPLIGYFVKKIFDLINELKITLASKETVGFLTTRIERLESENSDLRKEKTDIKQSISHLEVKMLDDFAKKADLEKLAASLDSKMSTMQRDIKDLGEVIVQKFEEMHNDFAQCQINNICGKKKNES